MLRAIVWKEIREQWLIGGSLVVLGSGALVAAASLAEPPMPDAPRSDVIRHLGAGLLATLMLSVTAGMVCGGAVFAAEREAGTMAFLESLPASRWWLWVAKLVAGVGLAAAQIAVLILVASLLGLVPSLGWAIAIAVFAMLAFFWGTFGSTAAQTTLGSVGLALPLAALTAILVIVPIALFSRGIGSGTPRLLDTLAFLGLMFAVPVFLSGWIFTAPDRDRAAEAEAAGGVVPGVGGDGKARGRSRIGLRALVWLTTRQVRLPFLVLSGFALVTGLTFLAPGTQPLLSWPAAALLAGVLAGVTAFGDEQIRGSARYWGEQRLPVGRLWSVKIGLHALFCLWLLLLLAAPLAIQAQTSSVRSSRGHTVLAVVFRSLLFDELGRFGWRYLLVPAVYGFVAGHLCGLVFRKLVVACGVAGIVGGFGAVAWGPSLLAGGVNHWQLWLPTATLLLTARLLIPAWTADALATRRPIITLVGGSLAALLVLFAGIGYRVLEVPNRPDSEADIAYVGNLIPLDDNPGWRLRSSAEQYALLAATSEQVAPMGAVGHAGPGGARRSRTEEKLDLVLRRGWPGEDAELGPWLDRVFESAPDSAAETWLTVVEQATDRRVGVYEYPQLVGISGPRDNALQNGLRMSIGLLARGLQKQAAGDSGEFVVRFHNALVLAQTMQNGTIISAYQTGVEIERLALIALDRWLERLPPGPQSLAQLRAVVKLLEAHEPTTPFDPTRYLLSERYILREGLKAPEQWLPQLLTPMGKDPEAVNPEVDLVALAWAVPWERERSSRLMGLGYESGRTADPTLLAGRPGAQLLLRPRSLGDLAGLDRNLRLFRRAAILKLALRGYHAEHGQYPDPDSLGKLVAGGFLASLPADPYDETRGFGYRISRGEKLLPPPRKGPTDPIALSVTLSERDVPAGQAILWSVGNDKINQGGTSLPVGGPGLLTPPQDLVFLVPLEPSP